mmetsp:Transcript_17855/g.35650  ORF Transcript_17855/g.35650 Transcript_17855/m.35650 type:complete len:894 (+) Transcript_17855:145-2826(+)|eukprot:CAMPEP_0194325716 /NCGR_PEP_ID=MMETSP0171-20130528/32522_1 /TAXON_ID=218684 /ORGANISM="Corethron pennatum, Strain L29A3" /LENGTH=893 /DNA_ID=CAMNT_0039084983 /DNA_START=40 /DNA_END=2721 /DNA_ORIENTATION=-
MAPLRQKKLIAAFCAALPLAAVSAVEGETPPFSARSLLESIRALPGIPRGSVPPPAAGGAPLFSPRRLAEGTCDVNMAKCISETNCYSCVGELIQKEVAFMGVTRATPCTTVLQYIKDAKLCPDLKATDKTPFDAFCEVFGACTKFEDEDEEDDGDYYENDADQDTIGCDELTECKWEGFREAYLGDGNCDATREGCYNTAVCGFDGGDCCEDTCTPGVKGGENNHYDLCGTNGYRCADPKSDKCEKSFNDECPEAEAEAGEDAEKKEEEVEPVKCSKGSSTYTVLQRSTWDGWGNATISVDMISDGEGKEVDDEEDGSATAYSGGLQKGLEGTSDVCFKDGCYKVKTTTAQWGNDISWEVKSTTGVMMAHGTANNECTFPIGGNMCDNTCDKSMEETETGDHGNDEVDVEKFGMCMNEKCSVQLGICSNDAIHCSPCLGQIKQSYCYTNTNYKNIIMCGMCSCLEGNEEECEKRQKSSKKFSPATLPGCTQTDNNAGAGSLLKWSVCGGVGSVSSLLTDWDENDFGGIDSFEACAHEYNLAPKSSNRTALECTQILVDTIASPDEMDVVESITGKLYADAPALCDCTYDAYQKAPLCKDFVKLRTIMHETLDACNALDQIDCPAWEEYAGPCKTKMEAKFKKIDFKDKKQCAFIEGGCGGVGPFPVFRRQDCGKELSKSTWDFHQEYGTTCNQEDTTQKMENKKKEEDKRKRKKKKKEQSKDKNKGDDDSDDDDNDDSSGGSGAVTPGNSKTKGRYDVNDDESGAPKKKYVSADEGTGVLAWMWRQLKRFFWLVFWGGIAYGIFTFARTMDWDDVNDQLFHYSHRARENTLIAKVSGGAKALWTKVTTRGSAGGANYQHIPQGYTMGAPETEMFMPSQDNNVFQPPSLPEAF